MSEEAYQFVRYLPWRGDQYGPESMFGLGLLIVGESHYWWDKCIDDSGLTRRVIEHRITVKRDHFDNRIAEAVVGYENLDDTPHRKFWKSVAFYNYLRHLMRASSKKPTSKMFKEEAAVNAFREVLVHLNPRLVVVFSQTVFKVLA